MGNNHLLELAEFEPHPTPESLSNAIMALRYAIEIETDVLVKLQLCAARLQLEEQRAGMLS